MDSLNPLRVHFGKERPPLIIYNNRQLGRLTQFRLHASTELSLIETQYTVGGCYPSWEPPPEDGLSNEAYPLRMSFDHTADKAILTYLGRPIGRILDLLIELTATEKPIIRLSTYSMQSELLEALLDLGVEVIIVPVPLPTETKHAEDDRDSVRELPSD